VSPRHLGAMTLTALLASACVERRDSATDPVTEQAGQIAGLWWFSVWLGAAVWVAVMVLLAIPVLRSRRNGDEADARATDRPATRRGAARASSRQAPGAALDEPLAVRDRATHTAAQADATARGRLVWVGGIIVPVLILLVLLAVSGRVGAGSAHVERDGELVVEVVGHMYWWEVHYPGLDITTANEITVPVDRPVRLRLRSDDVIHSFWIPRLHGKVDMIPGHENWLSFEATEPGRYRGNCAEFCGVAHAQMVAFVDAVPAAEFDTWVASQQADAAEPDGPGTVEGQRVFLEAGCAACHAVRGTGAIAGVGPDLTHLASRGTLAAGIVPNTRENLERLIVDPWGLKPGNPMPPTVLTDEELDALLDYLESLEGTP
jgi:cytochrome c oxidase subunit II